MNIHQSLSWCNIKRNSQPASFVHSIEISFCLLSDEEMIKGMAKYSPSSIGKVIDKKLGLPEMTEEYSYEDAIRLARFAIRVHPNEPFLYFYLACFYSAGNQINKSLFYYEQALKRGFKNWEQICSDKSFENARNSPKFKLITSRYC